MSDQVGDVRDPDGRGAQPDTEPEQAGVTAAGSDPAAEPTLPEAVRTRVIASTAAAMAQLPLAEVPIPLRKVAKFAPNRRARLGGVTIAAQLAVDPLFRQRVAAKVLADAGDLGTALEANDVPDGADPVEVAALAYLSRPVGWLDRVAAAAEALQADAEQAAEVARLKEIEARVSRAEHERAVARVEADKLRDETARLREELNAMRDEQRTAARELREAVARERRASELLAIERGRISRTAADHDAEVRRLRARLAEAEDAAGANRAAASRARQVDDARLWLLLETIGQAASGLRRELALEPAQVLPADAVAEDFADRPGAKDPARRALDASDPARLDQLLAMPRAHLIIDGYNVTKTGFGDISLEQQRNRLVSAMGGIAAQTGAEVTVVFDGAERMVGLPSPPRGVRVLFSRKGELADELIRRLVRAEPAGRPVIVISSDREVADGVRRHGAYPLPSESLLRRMNRA
ncbi:MAG TPA: NYN domain-containing protein [Micromonosporaceae bacterium]|jgi:predicted RNA-binding protein with PIN domain